MSWRIIVIDPIRETLAKVGTFLPTLIGVLFILVVGWFIAKVIQRIVTRLLKLVRLDAASDRAGIADILAKGEIRYTLSESIGILIYWLVMLIVFVTAVDALGLKVAAQLLDKIVLYIPNVVVSIFILSLGTFVAVFLGGIVRTAAMNAGVAQARLLGQLSQLIVIIFAIAMALEQLNIGTKVIAISLNVILGAIGLACALAFGLGCKDIAAKFVSDLIEKVKTKKR